MQVADTIEGGFGAQAKFPSVPQLQSLLRVVRDARVSTSKIAKSLVGESPPAVPSGVTLERMQFLRLSLAQMATQGLRDQTAGGFFRYVVEPNWELPHFEKMLYDNALPAELYADAGHVLDAPDLSAIAADTLNSMVRELWDERGVFIASLSAVDVDDVEGGYYLITQA